MNEKNIFNELDILIKANKYESVVNLIEKHFPNSKKSSRIFNLLGVCKLNKKNRTKKDFKDALDYFDKAIKKEKNSHHVFLAIYNLILSCLGDGFKYDFFIKYIYLARKHYLNLENYFNENKNFLFAGYQLFKYLLDHKKINQISEKILQNDSITDFNFKSQCVFSNNYYYNWDQKDFYYFSQKNSKLIPDIKVEKKIKNKKKYKINLGFVGSDFRKEHSIIYFLEDLVKYIDKSKFNVYLFSFSKVNKDNINQINILKNPEINFFDFSNLNNQESVKKIQDCEIDILVDLMGLTNPYRVQIFNYRIAELQLSWLAYCNTTGLKEMDYIIADKNLILKNEEEFYVEKIIKLPQIWNSHCGLDFKPSFYPLPYLKKNFFTFGSFNNVRKISDINLNVWIRILKEKTNSILYIKSSIPHNLDNLKNILKEHGVFEQVKFFNRLEYDRKDHLNFYKEIDLALDTFPYNGVTTTFESLWMNVPVLTIKGFNFNSRCGESIMRNANLDYLISSNEKNYVNKALYLSNNIEFLIDIKKKIAKEILSSPLYDTKKFAKNFTNIIKNIYYN